MPTARITIVEGKKSLAVLRFRYTNDIYKGRLSIVGPHAADVRELLTRPMIFYEPSTGGPEAGKKSQPQVWPWLVAAVRYITSGDNALGTGFKIEDAPPKKFHRPVPEVPEGLVM